MSLRVCNRVVTHAVLPALMAVICALIAGRSAHAQGTMGMLPSPISTVELDGYAQRLGASAQQRRAMDSAHDHYKQEFRSLRETEIAGFLKTMREFDDGGVMPRRAQLDAFMKQMDDLAQRIAVLDNRFFDQLLPLLTEDQVALMPRVRLARQRARLSSMQMVWMGSQPPVDLSAIAAASEWTDADRTAANDLLSAYESRLTADMEKAYAGARKVITGIYDALANLGFSAEQIEDPEQMDELSQAMQRVWMEQMADNMARQKAMIEHNDRTMRSITAVLSPEAARQFRTRYIRRAYPEAAYALYPHDYVFAPALARDDLTPVQREAVIAARDQFHQQMDGILERAVDAARQWRDSVNMFEYDPVKGETYQKTQVELRAESDRARDQANAVLLAALGEDLLDKIGRLKFSHQEADNDDLPIMEGGMVGIEVAAEMDFDADDNFDGEDPEFADDNNEANDPLSFAYGFDQFVPPAITSVEIAEYAARLDLNDEQQTMLRHLHQRYMTGFNAMGERAFSELQKIINAMWVWDEQTQTSRGPTELTVNTAYRLRGEAIEAVQRSDAEFFEELELALLTPEQIERLPRVRLARERSIYSRGAVHWGGTESSLDLSFLAYRRQSQIPAERWPAVETTLAEYERRITPLFKDRFERAMAVQKAQELWQAEITRQRNAGQSQDMRAGMRYAELMREPQKALYEISNAIASLNRSTITALVDVIGGEAGHTLRDVYNRAAHPNVYGDGGSMHKSLRMARSLPDLTPEQTRLLNDLAARYHPEYAAFCDRMIEASGDNRAMMWATLDEDNIHDWQQQEETLAKLRFDRSELNARTAGQLRAILTAEQINRIGGLPKVTSPADFEF